MGGTMKPKRIVAMYAALAVVSFVALILAVSGAEAGIPKRTASCTAKWSPLGFRGNVLTLRGQIACTRPMKVIYGRASLLRIRLGGDEELGSPSPQASAHDDFTRTQVTYYAFQVSHVCRHSAVSYKWWFTIQTTAQYKAWTKPQRYQWFSNTLITDCG